MIFFCFSSKDRHNIVEAVLYHITNYKLPVWYDRYNMLLGDNRNYMNFEVGVKESKYYLIILSPNAIASKCANEEIDLIKKESEDEQKIVFPIFYNITAEAIPAKYVWLKKYVYKEISSNDDVYSACNHIVCRILLDELSKYKYKSISEIYNKISEIPIQKYATSLLNTYNQIDNANYNAKIAILYALYLYTSSLYDFTIIPRFYYYGIQKLFCEIQLNLKTDLREILICERSIVLLLNAILFGYIV